MQILGQQLNNYDMNVLRNQINQFILKHLGPDVYKNLREAINGLFEKGYL
jgi:hypothetical protein